MENAERDLPEVTYAATLEDSVRDADLVCVLTEWEEFRYADPYELGELVNAKLVIDGRNCLDQALWTAAGWQVRGMGRPSLV
jgi:UDPglucose 6-dehydrogenase